MSLFTPEGLTALIQSVGYLGLFAIIFAESGLFFGFFLPGDSLIFTAGLLASQGYLHIGILIPLLTIAAILGDNVGYSFGRAVGPKIFRRPDSLFFNQKYLQAASHFYAERGPTALVLARFMPIIRTFVPIVAGIGAMNYRKFFIYNVIGGVVWTVTLPLLGYFLGQTIPNIDRYLLPIIGLIILTSFLPPLVSWLRR